MLLGGREGYGWIVVAVVLLCAASAVVTWGFIELSINMQTTHPLVR